MSLPPNIVDFLFDNGNFDHILKKIFRSLDGNSLASVEATSRRWKSFIRQHIWCDATAKLELDEAWSKHIPTFSVKFHRSKLVSLACSAQYIVGGEEMSGNLVVYNRQEIVRTRINMSHIIGSGSVPKLNDGIRPLFLTSAHLKTVTTVCLSGDLLFTGSLDGSIRAWDITKGLLLKTIIKDNKEIHDLKVKSKQLFFTFGFTIMVYNLSEGPDGDLTAVVKTMLVGHKGPVLSLAINQQQTMASASGDKTVILWNIKQCKVSRTLIGHKAIVRCVAINQDFCASGSFDRTCRIWSLATGSCVREIQQELSVRSITMNQYRLVTGDTGGYVFIWSLPNCVDDSKGPDKLCWRAHNAIDSDRPMKEPHRAVYGVHMENGVLITLAGQNGRIGVQDFWDNIGPDVFKLESYVI
ncbi:F-box/WD repeat-containing protein 11-like [Tigriopus californicus]|uniref:F-box/WD repeat-containing protein 11-like n=1 Tax=Tigriopus californicus TaxID=6832 RepID=UPI0027DA45D4|nr:F-box/WD repeat-containing protein 11-like [Tigriopus californicus]